jgi:hypothetical protein
MCGARRGKTRPSIWAAPREPPPPAPPRPNLGWARATRSVALLEHLATAEARLLLQSVAAGEAEAPPTKAAKDALERQKPETAAPKKL